MYGKILVTLENTPTDRTIIEHVKELARVMHSSVVLLHIATGVPAQYHGAEAAGKEIEEDEAYLSQVRDEFAKIQVPVSSELGYGIPVKEIIKWIERNGCDLVAMSTHGHRFFADLLFGATASQVQHSVNVPMLLIRAS